MKFAWLLIERAIMPPTYHVVSIWIDTVVTGLVIVAISWFMEMAAEMREENELTV
jgi:hypothetical protein